MTRQEVLDQITETMGSVPDWLGQIPDPQLETKWQQISWFLSDSKLTAQQKALVSFGAAAAVHCQY